MWYSTNLGVATRPWTPTLKIFYALPNCMHMLSPEIGTG